MLVHFENKYGREKKHGKQLLLTGTLNTLLPADFSAATSSAYKLVMLLIKRRNFLAKQSDQFFMKRMFVSKESKDRRKVWVVWSEHSRKWSFIKRQTNGTSSDNKWQQMTTSENEWYKEWQRMTTSDNEWQWMTTNEW